jgi:hypothetical protein
MPALLCHCRKHLQASDDASLAKEVREHLMRDHHTREPTDEQVWDIVRRRAYSFKLYDPPQYARVSIDYFL